MLDWGTVRFRLVLLCLAACGGGESSSLDGGGDAPPGIDAGPDACLPQVGGPYWLEETQALAFDIACSGVAHPLELLAPPAGLTFANGHVAWTPGLDQAAVYDLTVRVPATGETAIVRIGVADKFDDPDNVPIVDETKYPLEMGLPVFHLTYGAIDFDTYHPGTLAHRGGVYTIEVKHRGNTTQSYPKNSYTLAFSKEQKFNEPSQGFNQKRRVCLTSTFDDTSFLRHRLAFHLWETMDPEHVYVQAYNAVVYANGQYLGLYAVSDRITGELVEDFGYPEDGNLYEAINHNANFKKTRSGGGDKASYAEGYEKKEGLPVDDFADLIALVGFVVDSNATDFRDGIDDRIDRRDFQDWWIHSTALAADDNMGKNSFLYHDPVGGLWRYIAWDFNGTFGQDWQTFRGGPTVNHEGSQNGLFNRLRAEPTFDAAIDARYAEVLRGPWAEAEVLATVDAWAAELRPAALRDERRWLEEQRDWSAWDDRDDFNGFDGEVAYVRQWIVDRWAWLRARYP
jgi:spore coat protein H